ncbi:MAG TPA: hypothetical protein VM073_12205 [Usitatibacter sp.]|nr:hypothetical protein [Usitatibacter sp.]
MKKTAFALCIAALAAPGVFASAIEPAEPLAFQPVNLRMTVDGCAFVPATVRVRAVANVLKVTQHLNNCIVPGPVEIADVRLGSLASGEYRVEVYVTPDASGTPAETLQFTVQERAEIAVFPPPPRPITDYSGLWGDAAESGWGLSLHQTARDVMFGALFVYGADREAEWFTLQGGRWESSTRWTATVYRTTGPFFAAPVFDPRLVLLDAVGVAALDFHQQPGSEGRATFTYSVDGREVAKAIRRTPL